MQVHSSLLLLFLNVPPRALRPAGGHSGALGGRLLGKVIPAVLEVALLRRAPQVVEALLWVRLDVGGWVSGGLGGGGLDQVADAWSDVEAHQMHG